MKLLPELVMALVIEFGAAARAEFDEAFHWYAERSGDTALSFAAEVELAGNPAILTEPLVMSWKRTGELYRRLA